MIIQDFQFIYNSQIKSKIDFVIGEYDCDWDPIIYTLNKGRNRFRSALAVVSGRINQIDPSHSATIGAVAELVHTAIIMQDDIADQDNVRRGDVSAWKKYGLDRTIFACEQVLTIAILLTSSSFSNEITASLIRAIYEVNRGQSLQVRSLLSSGWSQETLQGIHHDKTVLGRWALTCPCKLSNDLSLYNLFDKYARLLGEAGCIKNDLENILLDNGYDSTNLDLSMSRTTLPLTRLIDAGKLHLDDSRLILKQTLYESGVYDMCTADIERAVEDSILHICDIPLTKEKTLLIGWARYHSQV
jgi:geranylgeranyl pyrophosphate synthase